MFIRSNWLTALFRSAIFLLIFFFYLLVLSITKRHVLLSPTVIRYLSLFSFTVSFCFTYFEALFLGTYTFSVVIIFLMSWFFHYYIASLFISDNFLVLESNLSYVHIATNFLLISICVVFLSPSF